MTAARPADIVGLFRRAADSFGDFVRGVRDDQWSGSTPCTQWDVRALVNHLVYEMRWAVPLFQGSTIADVGDRFEGDLLGDDPVGAWDDAGAAAVSVVAEPGAMRRTVHLSFGDVPGEEYAWQLFADLTVHGWDLARATGQDETIDPALLGPLAEWFADQAEGYRSSGATGPRPPVADDADDQTRLLADFGRSA
jgi:uncharacterized protein (TIGR03086 family)